MVNTGHLPSNGQDMKQQTGAVTIYSFYGRRKCGDWLGIIVVVGLAFGFDGR